MGLNREEKLSCIISLEKDRKLGEWGKSALSKLLKEMGYRQALKDVKVCPECKGNGNIIETPVGRTFSTGCPTCQGTGKMKSGMIEGGD